MIKTKRFYGTSKYYEDTFDSVLETANTFIKHNGIKKEDIVEFRSEIETSSYEDRGQLCQCENYKITLSYWVDDESDDTNGNDDKCLYNDEFSKSLADEQGMCERCVNECECHGRVKLKVTP